MIGFRSNLNVHTPNDFKIWNLVDFEAEYGQTASSGRFGVVMRVRGNSVPGAPHYDTFFILINSQGILYVGTQVNMRDYITWTMCIKATVE